MIFFITKKKYFYIVFIPVWFCLYLFMSRLEFPRGDLSLRLKYNYCRYWWHEIWDKSRVVGSILNRWTRNISIFTARRILVISSQNPKNPKAYRAYLGKIAKSLFLHNFDLKVIETNIKFRTRSSITIPSISIEKNSKLSYKNFILYQSKLLFSIQNPS